MIEMLENYLNEGYRILNMDIEADEEEEIEIQITLKKREWDY